MHDTTEQSIDGISRPPQISVHVGTPKPPKPKKRHWGLRIFIAILVLAIILLIWLFRTASSWSAGTFVGQHRGFFSSATDLIRGSTGQAPLEGEKNGVIRILLLGIGGEGHDGPYLSDSIILAQLTLDTGEVSLTSIPRDYQVKLPQNYGYRKINAAFAEGFNRHKDWNEAGLWARTAVSQLAGVDVPYFAVIDFSGFEKAIDQVGGIDVHVDRTFTDYQYPDSGTGYLPPQTFTEGAQHLDGKRALIFARSRHAAGPEGSDFARSQRQQKVMQAFRAKVFQLNLIADSGNVSRILQTFASHFHTNLSPGQLLRLAKVGQKIEQGNVVATSLDPATGLVCSDITEDTKAYILIPCYGKSSEDIQNFFKNALAIGKLSREKSVVWIATTDPKLARYKRIEAELVQAGLTVWPITYSEIEPEQSVVYQINAKPATAEYLKRILNGREVSVPPPNIKIDATRSDVILILGENIPERFLKPLPAPLTPKPAAPSPATQNFDNAPNTLPAQTP